MAERIGSAGSQIRPHLVNTYGRSGSGLPTSAAPTTSSEWPWPYTGAVSIQLIPHSTACRMVAIESRSDCGPQACSQPSPPMAQAP